MKHRFWFLVIGLTLVTSPAFALPCRGKLENGADRYRIVDGQKCWFAGKRVPDKSEFTVKRKEVVQHARPPGAAAHKTVPAAAEALAMADDAWLEMKRLQGRDALCGGEATPCPDFSKVTPYGSPAARVHDSFNDLMAQAVVFSSAPIAELRPSIPFQLVAKREDYP